MALQFEGSDDKGFKNPFVYHSMKESILSIRNRSFLQQDFLLIDCTHAPVRKLCEE